MDDDQGRTMNLLSAYQTIADNLGTETGASDSLIHVHAGMAVLLLARIVTGRSLATWVPFSVVVSAALANEVLDYLHQGQIRKQDALLDIINTVFWPFILMVGLRLRRLRSSKSKDGLGVPKD